VENIKQKKNQKVLAIIPAKGNSKSIKNKNLVKIDNKTLIEHVFTNLKKVKLIDTIYCSTNEKKIINHCKIIGLPFEVRDENYCKDDSNIVDYLYEVLKKKTTFDIIILAQPTSPFINKKVIYNLIQVLKRKKYNSCQTISEVPHNFHYINQRKFVNNQVSFMFKKERLKQYNKQKKSKTFKFGNIIIFKRKSFLKSKNLFMSPCYGQKVNFLSSIDIDNKLDYQLAKILFDNKKILNKLKY